mgnify:CR=1 FL=1
MFKFGEHFFVTVKVLNSYYNLIISILCINIAVLTIKNYNGLRRLTIRGEILNEEFEIQLAASRTNVSVMY